MELFYHFLHELKFNYKWTDLTHDGGTYSVVMPLTKDKADVGHLTLIAIVHVVKEHLFRQVHQYLPSVRGRFSKVLIVFILTNFCSSFLTTVW